MVFRVVDLRRAVSSTIAPARAMAPTARSKEVGYGSVDPAQRRGCPHRDAKLTEPAAGAGGNWICQAVR